MRVQKWEREEREMNLKKRERFEEEKNYDNLRFIE